MTPSVPTPRGRVTITDVARTAGVSVATVSKVINGRYGVAAATHERVMKVVNDLGYSSSLIAASMRRQRTHVIGVLVAEFEPFALEFLHGVSQGLQGTPYDVLAFAGAVSAGSHEGWETRSLANLGGTLIDGAIVVTPSVVLPELDMPIVSIDPHTGTPEGAVVDIDNRRGGFSATEHLLSLGHTRIGHLSGRNDLESSRLRAAGYRDALTRAGIAVDEDLIVEGGYSHAESAQAAVRLFDMPHPPSAIFAANDISAKEVLAVAHARGIRVPEDLSVVGFDDIPSAIATDPPLTTVRQPLTDMGRAAVDLLLRMIDDDAPAEHVRMPSELVIRDSTAPSPS